MSDPQAAALVAREAGVQIIQGDCLEVLPTLEAGSVQLAICSPPYFALRSYLPAGHPDKNREIGSEPTPDAFVATMVEVFRQVRRVLRDDGCLVLNLGDSYAGSGKGPTGHNGIGDQGKRQGFTGGRGKSSLFVERGDDPAFYNAQNRAPGVPGLAQKNLLMIPFRVALALQADGWILRSVIPWVKRNCLSGGAWVYARSQKGDMPMTVKELARLDPSTVQLWNGERWTRLVKVWRVEPEGDPLEIRLRSGETIGCTPDHRWPTQRGLLHASELRVGDVVQTTRLPEREDARRPAALDDDDIGWFVGLYIAEGFRDGRIIHISSHTKETERQARLERIASAYDGTCWTRHNGGRSMTINLSGKILHGILDAYTEGLGAAGKHLTTKAWQRSDAFLRAVLDGYLHGDGHHDEKNRRWRLGFCKNDRWATDLRTLCARLGIGLRLSRVQHQLNGRTLPGWRGQIRFERDHRSVGAQFPLAEDGEIVGISNSRGRSFWDLEVADDPHLFALASGVLTHNSMPESVTDRPSSAVEYLFMFSKRPRYFWDGEAVRVPHAEPWRSTGKLENRGSKDIAAGVNGGFGLAGLTPREYNPAGRSFRNSDPFFDSWQGLLTDDDGDPLALIVNPAALKESHFAAFPAKLVEPFVKAGTSERGQCPTCGAPWRRVTKPTAEYQATLDRLKSDPAWKGARRREAVAIGNAFGSRATRETAGYQTLSWSPSCSCPPADPIPQTVLDPFGGSGTVGLVSDRLGRRAVLVELNESYCELARRRIAEDAGTLFGPAATVEPAAAQPSLFEEAM